MSLFWELSFFIKQVFANMFIYDFLSFRDRIKYQQLGLLVSNFETN